MDTHIEQLWQEYERPVVQPLPSYAQMEVLVDTESIAPAKGSDIFGHTRMYRYCRIENVPIEVLMSMYKNGNFAHDIPVKKYVEGKMLAWEQGLERREAEKECKKLSFESESADKKLKEIARDSRPHKKPIRKYLCPHCGLYHLTSRPMIVFSRPVD